VSVQTSPLLQVFMPLGQLPAVQTPWTQVSPFWQALPQAPQLSTWLRESQRPSLLQSSVPGRQAQSPETHAWSLLHWVPQPPQRLGSLWVSAQALPPPHMVVPEGHVHWPETHAPMFWSQRSPQAPQWLTSALRSAQSLPQMTVFEGHVHWPETHAPPLGQSVPQAPQWLTSALRSAQALPQLTVPAGQTH
jgi:hypothetical protein